MDRNVLDSFTCGGVTMEAEHPWLNFEVAYGAVVQIKKENCSYLCLNSKGDLIHVMFIIQEKH